MKAVELRCEQRGGVPLIADPSPRFGWSLEAEGRDRSQRSYRILVAAEGRELAREEGTLWDSGEVESERTIEIPYEGGPLPTASEVHWTVRIGDPDGGLSPWAEPARFRTGLGAWRASWIGCDRREHRAFTDPGVVEDPDEMLFKAQSAPFLRRAFELDRPVRRATLYATARGVLELRLNGQRVGEEVLAPGWTDYDRRIEYAAHDVTRLLHEEENVLGCILGDGWYAGFVGPSAKRAGALYGSEPELLCELHFEFEDGGSGFLCSDGAWRGTPTGPIQYADLLQGERHDARFELSGWSKAGYDDSDWDPVTVNPLDGVMLIPAQGPPIEVIGELAPVAVADRRPGTRVFDLGQNMVGWTRIRVEGGTGERVELRFGEALDRDGSVYQGNLEEARQRDVFVLRGGGVEEFEPRFTFHGFRYVEARGPTAAIGSIELTGRVVGSATPWTSSFSCSNEMVNRLYANVGWSQRGNFLSIPTDCPQRSERLGWLADAQVFLPTASLNADVAAFMTKWGDDILDAQSDEGAYPDVAPRVPETLDGGPGWADAGIIVPALLLERYGDRRLVERHWPAMERYMDYLLRNNPERRWVRRRNFDFGDWLAIGEETPHELIATAYWAHDATLMGRMARALGREDRAEHYDELRASIAGAFNAAHVGADGSVEGDTQTGYLLALGFDLLPASLRSAATRRLVANLERHGWHLTTGFIGAGLLCPVLTANGRGDVAHRLLLQETFPSWGYSIRQGATTIWERWDAYTEERGFATERGNSLNHYSLGAVGAWLIESVLGIRNGSGLAYEHVLIAPLPGALSSASGSYRSVRGEIRSEWAQEGDRFRLAVRIPANASATVVVPAGGELLLECGEPAVEASGVRSAVRVGDGWRVEVGSGEYEFECAVSPGKAGQPR